MPPQDVTDIGQWSTSFRSGATSDMFAPRTGSMAAEFPGQLLEHCLDPAAGGSMLFFSQKKNKG
jgi:hypothetical protein